MYTLLSLTKKNSALKALLDNVNTWRHVRLERSADDDGWGSCVDANGEAVVTCSRTDHPQACLAHELLHFDLQMKGYRRVLCGRPRWQSDAIPMRLIAALDNEVQHHKMFPNFRALGFPAQQFYNDDDKSTLSLLEQVFSDFLPKAEDIVVDFLTVIAPGGSFPRKMRESFKNRMYDAWDGQFRSMFKKVEAIIFDWASGNSRDSQQIFTDVLTTIKPDLNMWLGYNDKTSFPSNGFFIGPAFA